MVAARAFDVRGYAGATMGAIIGASSLSKGAVYFHFPSKVSIARDLVAGWLGAVQEEIEVAAGEGVSAMGQLRSVCGSLAGRIGGDVALRAGMKLTLDLAVGDGLAFRGGSG
ncbi:TetR/AcrR family transcriptional regulator [Rhodococcus globerulus]|uniref:TetR/AcrR family transcriptional regulator n=1 Tax=Rhodococcus globerulus TaxID=33008 RepID=A0ABU4C3B1_RHOGO|nr:TetR/AcrR family transcriptional regulator [Rhodococcus globerulus]MDV6270991.1 TetR/AcrR family transcriptional regulator [Rhodococcus globerulus]